MKETDTRTLVARGRAIGAKRAAALLAELEAAQAEAAQWRHANALAAQAFVQLDGDKAALESQLGQAHEQIAALESQLHQAEQRIEVLEMVVEQSGHAKSCALQYGGACSCRMQLVRREKARGA